MVETEGNVLNAVQKLGSAVQGSLIWSLIGRIRLKRREKGCQMGSSGHYILWCVDLISGLDSIIMVVYKVTQTNDRSRAHPPLHRPSSKRPRPLAVIEHLSRVTNELLTQQMRPDPQTLNKRSDPYIRTKRQSNAKCKRYPGLISQGEKCPSSITPFPLSSAPSTKSTKKLGNSWSSISGIL